MTHLCPSALFLGNPGDLYGVLLALHLLPLQLQARRIRDLSSVLPMYLELNTTCWPFWSFLWKIFLLAGNVTAIFFAFLTYKAPAKQGWCGRARTSSLCPMPACFQGTRCDGMPAAERSSREHVASPQQNFNPTMLQRYSSAVRCTTRWRCLTP